MHKAHAKYSPSASHRWLRCTGSIHLTKNIQEKQTPYSLQGQVAHFLAERCLLNPSLDPLTFVGTTFTDVGEYQLTEEDVIAVNKYVVLMREEINLAGKNAKIMIEKSFKSTSLDPNLFGTSDAVIITEDGILKIYDYKHGAGVLVSVKDNFQMLCYALLALSYAKENNINIINVEIIIVQPRASDDYISREFVPLQVLKDFKDLVLDKIEEIEDTEEDPILTVGEKQCRWCPIKHVCPEVMKTNLAIAKARSEERRVGKECRL